VTPTSTRVPTFRDPDLEARFRRDGYVVVDFAPPEVVAELLDVYARLDSGIGSGYYPSLMSADSGYKDATDHEVTSRLWPRFEQLLDGYRPHLGVFMVKHPGPDTEVAPHQDWIIADGSDRPSMTAWMPLTPVTDATGRMRVLPGSQHWLEGLRGSPSFPTAWEGVYERVRDELMVEVVIEVGQAMVYDISLLHGTPPNRSEDVRVVTSLYAVPEDTSPVHYYRAPDGDVAGYRVPSNFCTRFSIGDVPEGEPFVEIHDYRIAPLTFDEIAGRHARQRAGL
jgi:hypothetical protein